MIWLPLSMLVAVLAVAVLTDLRTRRIPNRLVLAGLALALGWHLLGPTGTWTFDPRAPGAVGVVGWLIGAGVMLCAFFPFYAFRAMGAGDVKLMAVVGAFFGARPGAMAQLAGAALAVMLAGGVLSIVRMAVAGRSRTVIANVGAVLGIAVPGGAGKRSFDPRLESADRMPYAVAIGAGVLSYLAGKWMGWITIL